MSSLPVVARRDPSLVARIRSEQQLVYGGDGGAVRGGSALAVIDGRMVVVEDAADRIVVIEGQGSSVVGLPLHAPGGRSGTAGGKGKLQLEAMVAARDWRGEYLLAFGSGASRERRCVARVRLAGGDTELTVFETRRLYDALEEHEALATSPLDLQGAAMVPKASGGRDVVRLFHRGHGKPRGALRPLPATVDIRLDALSGYLERVKRDPDAFLGLDLENARRYELGWVAGVPIGFTDAAGLPDGRVLFVGVAEMAVEGEEVGEVLSSVIGVIEADGGARYNFLVGTDGEPTLHRADGVTVTGPTRAYVVVGQNDPDHPSLLCELELAGF